MGIDAAYHSPALSMRTSCVRWPSPLTCSPPGTSFSPQGACPNNPHVPFDKLRVNWMGLENFDLFPFVLSPSKHKRGFRGEALRRPNWHCDFPRTKV